MNLLDAVDAKRPFYKVGSPETVFVGVDDHGDILKLVKEDETKVRVTLKHLFDDYEVIEPTVEVTRKSFWSTFERVFPGYTAPNFSVTPEGLEHVLKELGLGAKCR